MSTPPRTDVRQHTPDPRNKRRVTPSHLRIAQLGSAVNCSRTFACAPATRIQRTLETATIRGPHTAHRLFRSTGPPQRVMTLRPKRFRMIQGVPPSADTERYGGKRPRRLRQARNHIVRTPASSLRAIHNDPITGHAAGESHHTTEQACSTHG